MRYICLSKVQITKNPVSRGFVLPDPDSTELKPAITDNSSVHNQLIIQAEYFLLIKSIMITCNQTLENTLSKTLVAGAGFEPTTFGL